MVGVAEWIGVAAVLVTLTATIAPYPAIWRAFRDSRRPIPPERRRRVWFGYGVAFVVLVVVAVLLILEPFGPRTIVWLILVGGGALMLLALAAVAVQAVTDTRRARRRRLGPPSD
jgi:predicted lysophospholipase L1 biosynthesis ABC-type transport system permease subunit